MCTRMAMSSKATLGLLIYGIIMHCSVYCSPIGLNYPKIRLENEVYDEDGNSLPDLAFDSDQIAIRSPPSVIDDVYTLYYPPEKRTERHADGIFNKAYRKVLGQLSARKYLHSLMAKRVGLCDAGCSLQLWCLASTLKSPRITDGYLVALQCCKPSAYISLFGACFCAGQNFDFSSTRIRLKVRFCYFFFQFFWSSSLEI
nr:PREDICTED: pituitary adenylate cyclase-activating polypeptide isoform X5 [Lepisosteus oculatus]